MEPTASTTQRKGPETQKGDISFTCASNSDAQVLAFANMLRQEGRDAATAQYKSQLDEKNRIIAELQAKIAMMHTSTAQHTSSSRNYEYNASFFPKPNAELIIDALIELAESKREGGKYIISTKTDWYMVWKVLHFYKLYIGNEYDFIDVVNDCVLPYIPNVNRRKSLAINDSNFKAIKKNNSMKQYAVIDWRKELTKALEERARKAIQQGTPALDRGINIKVKLQRLLQAKGVESINYEK